jgi:AraC family transcriptional regulator of adaptative response/methylated-DNA-[protein]-cysteine methyltransferase
MIFFSRLDTVLGGMVACAVDDGICMLAFENGSTSEEISFLKKHFGMEACEGENEHILLLKGQLKEYFEGTRKEFLLRLCQPGTGFQKKVWNELLKIGYGQTRTYLEQSISVGNPLAIRAVAKANGANRIAIIIPCHRIIGSGGRLTGYAGGIERKRWLLDHESRHSSNNDELKLF